MKVEINGGKYTVVQKPNGGLEVLRYGEPWRECTGDGLILALAQEIEQLRAIQPQCAWQPINTAPRDGTIVDLRLTGGGRITDQWWDDDDKSWCGVRDEAFTHWAPVPDDSTLTRLDADVHGRSDPEVIKQGNAKWPY